MCDVHFKLYKKKRFSIPCKFPVVFCVNGKMSINLKVGSKFTHTDWLDCIRVSLPWPLVRSLILN